MAGDGDARSAVDALRTGDHMHAWHWHCTRLVDRGQTAEQHLAHPYCLVDAVQWY